MTHCLIGCSTLDLHGEAEKGLGLAACASETLHVCDVEINFSNVWIRLGFSDPMNSSTAHHRMLRNHPLFVSRLILCLRLMLSYLDQHV
jgi:hypothetical protein